MPFFLINVKINKWVYSNAIKSQLMKTVQMLAILLGSEVSFHSTGKSQIFLAFPDLEVENMPTN